MALLSTAECDQILQAIAAAERRTSGEIRVHVERFCPIDPMQRASQVFFQLGMHQTDLQNGCLLYLAMEDRKFAILGDKGIDARVPHDFWNDIKSAMKPHLSAAAYATALALGVSRIGEALSAYFPYEKGDVNELSDAISFGPDASV